MPVVLDIAIIQGERVAVAGVARWIADPNAEGGNHRETPQRLVLRASESVELLLSVDPRAAR